MDQHKNNRITVEETVAGDAGTLWDMYTGDAHITQWHVAADTWRTPRAVSEVKPGGRFSYRMESRDGSAGFDFEGTFDVVDRPARLAYTLSDGRRAEVRFDKAGGGTHITVTFDPDSETDRAMQRAGWQAILTNFRRYAEGRQGGATGA